MRKRDAHGHIITPRQLNSGAVLIITTFAILMIQIQILNFQAFIKKILTFNGTH